MILECPISLGELVDKISILKIKISNLSDALKKEQAQREYEALTSRLEQLSLSGIEAFLMELIKINTELWGIEDCIRLKEKNKDFDQEFIDLARSVYKTNDQRFRVKNEINCSFGSFLKEVKSYEEYE